MTEQEGKGVDVVKVSPEEYEMLQSYRRQQSSLKDQPQVLEFLARPQAIFDSEYHHYISKNLPLAYFKSEDEPLAVLFDEAMNLAIYMEKKGWCTKDIPNEVSARFDVWLNATRARDGKFADGIMKQTQELRQIIEEKGPKKSFWKGG